MNIISMLVGGGFLLFASGMFRLYWHVPQSSPAAAERITTWKSEFGFAPYFATVVAPLSVYGTSLILASFEATTLFAYPITSVTLLLCAACIAYFYFLKKQRIADPLASTHKVFSDMRAVAVALTVFAISRNEWLTLVVSLLFDVGVRVVARTRKQSSK